MYIRQLIRQEIIASLIVSLCNSKITIIFPDHHHFISITYANQYYLRIIRAVGPSNIEHVIQWISLNPILVNRTFRKQVGCEALVPIQDNGSL